MADPKVKLKRSAVAGRIPSVDQVPLGELALNTWDGQLFASKNVGLGTTVVAINPWVVGTGTDSYNAYFTAGNVGIGITVPTSTLHVNGDVDASNINVSGVITATSFSGDGSALTGIQAGYFEQNQTGIHTIGNVGIGTTTATGAADTNNTYVLNAGIVTANYYYGDGSNLTGVGGQITLQDSGASRGTPTTLNFGSGLSVTTASGGISTITATASGGGTAGVDRNITTFVATAGQTAFAVSYTVGDIDVFLNGIRLLDTTDYTATDGSSVNLVSSASGGDEITVIEYLVSTTGNGVSGFKTTKFTATSGQTDFNVSYALGTIEVYRNGIRLVDGDDFTATDGTTVTLVSAASGGDSIVVVEAQGLFGVNQTGINTTSNLGIGTTSAYNALTVVGDANISGVLTATTLYGNGANLTGIQAGYFVQNQTGIHTTGNIGVGTTSAYDALTVVGDANVSGVVTATAFYGDGSNLQGVVSGVGVALSTYKVGYAQTTIEFIGSGVTVVSIGDTTQVTIEPGLVGAAKSVTSFTATAGQTAFNVDHSTGQENVFLNGVRLSESQYTTNGSTITLNDAAADGDSVDIVVYLRGSDPNRNIEVNLRPPFNGITTAFTMYRGTSDTLFSPVDERQILVSLGGVIQQPGIAYTVGTGSSIFFSAAPGIAASCFITGLFSTQSGISTDATKIETQLYSPTGVQTSFTLTRGYEQNYLDVYVNGARLVSGQDYTATDSSTFSLTSPAQAGDTVEAVAFRTVGITSAVTAGISSNVDGDYVNTTSLSATGISTLGNVVIGAGGTDLLVEGNARVTGILTIGESSLALAGAQDANTITIGSTERVRFFDDGRTIFGSSTDKGAFSTDQERIGRYQFISPNYQVAGFYRYGADGTQITLGASRGTEASPTQLDNNDYSGILQFKGHTGTYFADMASIECRAEEALTNSGSGAEIIFATTGIGSTSATKNVLIRHNGSLECRGDANPNALFDRGSANTTNVNINYNGTLRGQLSGGASHFQISAAGTGSDIEFYTEGSRVGGWDGEVLEINDPSAAGWAIYRADGGTTSARGRMYSRTNASCSGTQEIFQIYLGSTEKFRIRADGNVTNANNSYGALSDQKLKENIVDASSQWEDIKNITIRNFNFKASTGHDTSTMIGVVAQELELVSPGLVEDQVDKEVVDVPVLDEDGNAVLDENGDAVTTEEERETGTVTKTVKTSVLHMKALKALQEAMARIESLEAQVTALQNNVGIAST